MLMNTQDLACLGHILLGVFQNTITIYSEYSCSGIVPKGGALNPLTPRGSLLTSKMASIWPSGVRQSKIV